MTAQGREVAPVSSIAAIIVAYRLVFYAVALIIDPLGLEPTVPPPS